MRAQVRRSKINTGHNGTGGENRAACPFGCSSYMPQMYAISNFSRQILLIFVRGYDIILMMPRTDMKLTGSGKGLYK